MKNNQTFYDTNTKKHYHFYDEDSSQLIDIKNDKTVFASKESMYCFAPVDWVGEWISKNLHKSGTIDLGGKNAIKLFEVAQALGSKSIFNGPIDNQIVSKEMKNAPESRSHS